MRYLGSKAKIAGDIMAIIESNPHLDLDTTTYIEPFCGGLNSLQYSNFKNRVGYDSNKYLIAMWVAVLSGWIPGKYNKLEYLHIRDNMDQYPDHVVGWVGFCCSYSGKFFGGYAGLVLKARTEAEDYQEGSRQSVMRQLDRLKGVVLDCRHYMQVNRRVKGCAIYCDPPYQGVTKYNKGGDLTMTCFGLGRGV